MDGNDIMAAVDETDKILKQYMEEWDELGLDLVINSASLMPAPLKASLFYRTSKACCPLHLILMDSLGVIWPGKKSYLSANFYFWAI